MSEAASIPFSETKAPESPDRLNRGALRLVDISASTMANIGPAYSFYFGAGFLFLTAGLRAWSVPFESNRVVHGELSRDGGYQAMSEILAAGPPLPDCVFAVSDIMAVGALARLRAAGIDVPGDIALAGFDDIPTLRDVYPPLTTVRLPLRQLGEIAARLVLGGDTPDQPRVVPVPGEVVLRDSTQPRPPSAR